MSAIVAANKAVVAPTKDGTSPADSLNLIPDSIKPKEAADAAFWRLGVRVLTDAGTTEQSARAFLGKHYKTDRGKLAEVVAYLATNPKLEPKSYIEKAMQPEVRKLAI